MNEWMNEWMTLFQLGWKWGWLGEEKYMNTSTEFKNNISLNRNNDIKLQIT